MPTCIYYELDVVAADDARRARSVAGPGAREFTAGDAIWSDDIPGQQPERLWHARSLRLLEDLLPRVTRWQNFLAAEVPQIAERHQVSLPETAKYYLLFDVAAAAQRWRAVSEMCRGGADRIVWITSRADHDLETLRRAAAVPIEVHQTSTGRTPLGAAWQTFKDVVAPGARRAASIAWSSVRSPRWPEGRVDVVCTEFFANNVGVVLPVAQRLQAEYGLRVQWLAARKPVADALAARGVECLLLPAIQSARSKLRGRLSAADRQGLSTAIGRLPGELFEEPAEQAYLSRVLESRVPLAWNHAAIWVEAYDEALAVLRPSAVMSTTYSNIVGRASALVAQKYGGHAVYLQHGLFPRCPAFCSFAHDLLLMWGPSDARNLTDFGVDPRSIRVTGAVNYDALAKRRAEDTTSELGPAERPLKIAFMASRTGGMMVGYEQARQCLLAAATAARRLGGAHLTVKLHPGDRTGMIPEVMRDFPEFSVVQSGSSHDTIVESDLVIVVSSTTGLEACVAGKPLVVLDVSNDADAVPYASYGAAVRVSVSAGDLAGDIVQAVTQLRQDATAAQALAAGRARLLDDMLAGARGDAAERAALAVAEFLGCREPQPAVHGSSV